MMREVCFLLTNDQRILRIYCGNASTIPDSKSRWNAIWTYRYEIDEIVHTHPAGLLRFSGEDLTTMQAVEAATGREFTWSIVTRNAYLYRNGFSGEDIPVTHEGNAWWIRCLRDLSFNTIQTTTNSKTQMRSFYHEH